MLQGASPGYPHGEEERMDRHIIRAEPNYAEQQVKHS